MKVTLLVLALLAVLVFAEDDKCPPPPNDLFTTQRNPGEVFCYFYAVEDERYNNPNDFGLTQYMIQRTNNATKQQYQNEDFAVQPPWSTSPGFSYSEPPFNKYMDEGCWIIAGSQTVCENGYTAAAQIYSIDGKDDHMDDLNKLAKCFTATLQDPSSDCNCCHWETSFDGNCFGDAMNDLVMNILDKPNWATLKTSYVISLGYELTANQPDVVYAKDIMYETVVTLGGAHVRPALLSLLLLLAVFLW